MNQNFLELYSDDLISTFGIATAIGLSEFASNRSELPSAEVSL
jgi:hypothetical protein